MPKGSPVKLIHDVFTYRAADHVKLFPDWHYAKEFDNACEKDGGKASENISADAVRVYCEKDGLPYWEYIEGYTDVLPIYTGTPLNEDHTVFYRAIAIAPSSN